MLGIAVTAVAVLIVGEIVAARSRTYLVDVPFTVDRTIGSTGNGRAPLELRVLGDSTAAGVGVDCAEDALPALLAERVAHRTGRPVHVVGLGVSGAETADLSTGQIAWVRDADVIVLVVGSNDVIHATGRSRMREQTAQVLSDATATGASVVLGGIPRFYGVRALAQPLRAMVDGYAAVLRDVQRDVAASYRGVVFVDIAALASPRFLGVPDSMSSDAFHPSTVGYGFWADALAPAVVAAASTPQ
ncbi:MAG TPA: SGNH/GDSL hydrolase family protein [Euzebyales bacterium]|nr:SGNH/GDSL hydrolase family protein [Euzebyales bacterium]